MKTSILLAVALITGSAFGKVTMYNTADVMRHVLTSKVITDQQAPGKKLAGTDFSAATIATNGKQGIGEKFTVNLKYANLYGGLMTVCGFTATVENLKANTGPAGLVANYLTAPVLSKIDCAY